MSPRSTRDTQSTAFGKNNSAIMGIKTILDIVNGYLLFFTFISSTIQELPVPYYHSFLKSSRAYPDQVPSTSHYLLPITHHHGNSIISTRFLKFLLECISPPRSSARTFSPPSTRISTSLSKTPIFHFRSTLIFKSLSRPAHISTHILTSHLKTRSSTSLLPHIFEFPSTNHPALVSHLPGRRSTLPDCMHHPCLLLVVNLNHFCPAHLPAVTHSFCTGVHFTSSGFFTSVFLEVSLFGIFPLWITPSELPPLATSSANSSATLCSHSS